MYRKNVLRIGVVLLAVWLAGGCRAITEVQPEELEGTWIASQARFLDPLASKQHNVDLIEEGWEVVFQSPGDGTFRLIVQEPDLPPDVTPGTLVISGPLIALMTENGEGAGEIFLEDDQVAFRLSIGLEFVYNPGEDPVPSTLLLVMDRISLTVEPA